MQAARLRVFLTIVAPRFPQYKQMIESVELDQYLATIRDEELLFRFSSAGFTDAATYVSIDADALREIDSELYYVETTSGTTAAPKSRYATVEDDLLDQQMIARSFTAFGVAPHHRVLTVDLGELNFFAVVTKGLAQLGVFNSLYCNARMPFNQSMVEALECQPDVLVTVPSILMRSFSAFVERLRNTPSVKKLVYYAEPMDRKIRQFLHNSLGVETFSLYSSIEAGIMGAECEAHDGIHLWTDCLLPALKDPAPVDKTLFRNCGRGRGLQGSLGVTTLIHVGKPTFAYLIGDTVQYTDDRCACGRTLPRIQFVQRDVEVFSIYGVKCTFKQIHGRVYRDEDVTSFLQIVLDDDINGTVMRLVLPNESLYTVESRQAEISDHLRSHAGLSFLVDHGVLSFEFKFVPGEFFTERKIRRVVDLRARSRKQLQQLSSQ